MKIVTHTGPQNCSYGGLRRARPMADDDCLESGSIWDPFHPALADPIAAAPQVMDRIEDYRRAGADWVIVAPRAPFDGDAYELFIDGVLAAFRETN